MSEPKIENHSIDAAKPSYPMEVSTFLTGVQNPHQHQKKIGQVTGKDLDEVFPNFNEIDDTFGKFNEIIEVSVYPFNLLYIRALKKKFKRRFQATRRTSSWLFRIRCTQLPKR